MRFLLLLSLLTFSEGCFWVEEEACVGSIIRDVYANKDDCRNLCKGDSRCNCVTYFQHNGVCRLETGHTHTDRDRGHYLGMEVNNKNCDTVDYPCTGWINRHACVGDIIADIGNLSKDACLARCWNDNRCNCATWLVGSNTCRLETGTYHYDRGTNAYQGYSMLKYSYCGVIDRVDYNLDNVVPRESSVKFGKKLTVQNGHGVPREGVEVTFEDEVSEEFFFEHQAGVSITVGTSVEAGIPFVTKGRVQVDVTGSYDYTWGEKVETTQKKEYKTSVNVGPFERVVAKAIVIEEKFDVPYTIRYAGGTTSRGMFRGLSVGGIEVEYNRYPMLSDNCKAVKRMTNKSCGKTRAVTASGTQDVNTADKCAGFVWGECTWRGYFQWRSHDFECLCVEDGHCPNPTTGAHDVYQIDCTSGLDYCEGFVDAYQWGDVCYQIWKNGDCDDTYELCHYTCCIDDYGRSG